MIVLDASAAVDFVVGREAAARIQAILRDQVITVPVHFDAEVFAGVRRSLLRREIDVEQARFALFLSQSIRARRAAIGPLLSEAFALRDRFGPYDAFYAIVARLTEASLVTTDRGLARAAEGYCKVEYVALS